MDNSELETFFTALIAGAVAIEKMENSINTSFSIDGKSIPFREAAIVLREKACEIANQIY